MDLWRQVTPDPCQCPTLAMAYSVTFFFGWSRDFDASKGQHERDKWCAVSLSLNPKVARNGRNTRPFS